MSIFRRQPDNGDTTHPSPPERERPAPPPGTRGKVTHVAAGSRIEGTISGATELFVEGEVEGHIRLDERVTVGPGGLVKGEIEARLVSIGGRVQGNVRGRDRVEVTSSGALEGDVAAPRVVVAEGAFFKGRVEMTGVEEGKEGKGRKGVVRREESPSSEPTTPPAEPGSGGQAETPKADKEPEP